MANHVSHAALPYPIKGCRYTLLIPYLDADGDPTDPTTPDTERSIDAAAFADCTEEVSTITGSNGMGYITLTGDEMNGSLIAVAAKVASGPKATLAMLQPRVLPVFHSGTAAAGAAGTITLASGALAIDDIYNGMIIRTTGGTGGAGGSGSQGNQARVITDYVGSTKVATITPNWETNPDSTTTYEVLLTEVSLLSYDDLQMIRGSQINAMISGRPDVNVGAMQNNVITAAAINADAITAAKIADGAIDAATFAAGAINAAAIAADAIGASELAADAVTEIQSGLATAAALSTAQTAITAIKAQTDLLSFFQGILKAAPMFATGTAQSSFLVMTTLDAGASAVDNAYIDCWVWVVAGTGVGQIRRINSYTGSTKVAITDYVWDTDLDATSKYIILPIAGQDVAAWDRTSITPLISGRIDASVGAWKGAVVADIVGTGSWGGLVPAAMSVQQGTVVAAGTDTFAVTLAAAASIIDDYYKDCQIWLMHGTGAGQVRRISGYIGSSQSAVVDVPFVTAADSTTYYIILPGGTVDVNGWVGDNINSSTDPGKPDVNVVDMDSNVIGAAQLQSNTITAAKIATDAITAAKIAANALDAVWSTATRILTAGTNIVLAKGVGVTGFNDLSAAQVNAEADTALADYDGPTHAELVSEIDDVQTDVAAVATDVAAVATAVAAVQSDTNDLQTRVPAVLIGGRIDASIGSVQSDVIAEAGVNGDLNTYQARIDVVDDNDSSVDRYMVCWFRNGMPVLSGITLPTMRIYKSDGTDLVGTSAMIENGTEQTFHHFVSPPDRMVDGEAYIALATATIDGDNRSWLQIVGRDS